VDATTKSRVAATNNMRSGSQLGVATRKRKPMTRRINANSVEHRSELPNSDLKPKKLRQKTPAVNKIPPAGLKAQTQKKGATNKLAESVSKFSINDRDESVHSLKPGSR